MRASASGFNEPSVNTLATPGAAGSLGANKNIVIDTTAPVVSFTNTVDAGPVATDTIRVTVTETNASTTLQKYAFSADATCNAADFSGGEATFTSGVDFFVATEANNGKYLCLSVTDQALNTTYLGSAAVFNVDRTAPVITFTDDVSAGPVGVEDVAATVTDANPDTSTYRWGFVSGAVCNSSNDASLTNTFNSGASFSFTDTVEAHNGEYICVKAVDLVGTVSYNTRYVGSSNGLNVDNTPPDVPEITSPANGSFSNTDTPTFSGIMDEPSVADSPSTIRVYQDINANNKYDGGTDLLLCTSSISDDGDGSLLEVNQPWAGCTSGVSLADGIYTISTESEDPIGNVSSSTDSGVTIDTTFPVLGFTDDVSAASTSADIVVVTVTETNHSTSTYKYTFSTDSTCNAADFTGGEAHFTTGVGITFNTEANNGKYFCTVATDAAGNTTYFGTTNPMLVDITPAVVTNVAASTANGSYKAGDVVNITIKFNEVMYVGGSPTLTLSTGATSTGVASYASGDGSDTLTFAYTIGAGQNASDLDYATTGSLVLGGGTIRDLALNDATLTLPSPGAAGSLGANAAIVVDTTAPSAPAVPDMVAASDTGTSNTDNITTNTAPSFTVATCESGATVTMIKGTTTVATAACAICCNCTRC
jgi:hypothetical protein